MHLATGLRPDPLWERSPEPLAGFKGMGGERMREKGEGKEGVKGKGKGRGGKGKGKGKRRGGRAPPHKNLWPPPWPPQLWHPGAATDPAALHALQTG